MGRAVINHEKAKNSLKKEAMLPDSKRKPLRQQAVEMKGSFRTAVMEEAHKNRYFPGGEPAGNIIFSASYLVPDRDPESGERIDRGKGAKKFVIKKKKKKKKICLPLRGKIERI